ncbi:transpeptidase family protein [bacterium]|nr:transpeptidase family protein [bacterium]
MAELPNTIPVDPDVQSKLNRLRLLVLFFLVWSIVLVLRLLFVQVIDNDQYQLMAKRQYERNVTIEAERGTIYDRNMNKLAVNLINYSFAADPSYMAEKDKDRVAENFARVFQKPVADYRKLLAKKTAFVWLERRVSEPVARKIDDSIKGLIKLQSLRRHYPYGKAASQILGFTNIDNEGASGLELSMHDEIGGENGWAILQADALGRLLPSPDYPHQDPVNGNGVVLTLDINYQVIAQQEIERAIDDYDADDGMVVILSPLTGEVLAMANAPGFDPNQPEKYDPSVYRNRIITDLYEPGSTFKAFSAVSAVEEKVVTPDDRIFCENGAWKYQGHIIHDSKPHGTMTFTQVVEKSSNIGIIKTTDKLGGDRLYQYVRAFGFGNETGIDIEGEVKGQLKHPTQWSGLTQPMISIGQEIGVTALQLANAYCAIANGGTLYKPFMIRSIIHTDGTRSEDKEAQVIRTVASKETMNKVSEMLKEVVVSGTGKRAQIRGIQIAGKTGTAQKVEGNGKGYSKDHFTASFVGFFPVQNPQLVFLVIVNNPRKSIWGEASAAVTARSIIEKIINSSDDVAKKINRVMAEIDADSNKTSVYANTPDLKYLSVETAKTILDKTDFHYRITGEGDMVADQKWTLDGETAVLQLFTTNQLIDPDINSGGSSLPRLPDVRGLSTRMAVNKLFAAGFNVKIKGSGYVLAQYPKPGIPAKPGDVCVIQCQPL